MSDRAMLLVEDNPNDVKLTTRALKKNLIANNIVIAGDGVDLLSKPFGESLQRM